MRLAAAFSLAASLRFSEVFFAFFLFLREHFGEVFGGLFELFVLEFFWRVRGLEGLLLFRVPRRPSS